MNPQYLQSSNTEDSLTLYFDGLLSSQPELEIELEPFVQALEKYAEGWMPELVNAKRHRRYSRASIWKAIEEAYDEFGVHIGFYRKNWPSLSMSLDLILPPREPELGVSFSVQPISFFSETARCSAFVELVRAWAARYPVSYAMAHSRADVQLADYPSFRRDDEVWKRDGHDKVYEVFWINVLGPRLVETVGRERMLSTPAYRVEELPNGSILLVLWPGVTAFSGEEARRVQARALVHLRPDLDFDTVLRTLLERNAALAPVEPRFTPDMAPLLSRVVDCFAISQRQRKIAEFNVWQPPEPDEWLPVGSALLPDVSDPDNVLTYYGQLSERVVALLHSQVPSVMTESPESLTDADFYFWYDHFPEISDRENLDEYVVPAVGAYLGEVLVRHLGGKWIPRKKLGEAQVVVGGRVWFPMLRAHHYLRSRQSILDSSLTQLYREAERYRK